MKKLLDKRVFKIMAIILAVWISLMLIDTAMVINGSKPLFSFCPFTADDGGSGLYIGLGYSFDIDGHFLPEDNPKGVTDYDFRLFGLRLFGSDN